MRSSSRTNLVRSLVRPMAWYLRFLSAAFRGRKHVTGLRPAGTKGRSFRGTTRFRRSGCAAALDFRRAVQPDGRLPIGAALITLALCAGVYLDAARPFCPGLTGPFALASVPAPTSRRISGTEYAGYYSRSQPYSIGRQSGIGRAARQPPLKRADASSS